MDYINWIESFIVEHEVDISSKIKTGLIFAVFNKVIKACKT